MKLDPAFIEVACFLGVDIEGKIVPKATAFYVVVPFKHDRMKGRAYLVTARHNLESARGKPLFASINTGNIGADRAAEWLPIVTDHWFFDNQDNSSDLAIADWRPSESYSASYLGVLTDNFIEGPPESGPPFPLNPGLETATVGLFSYHSGRDRHTPILRSGSIAALPTEPIMSGLGAASGYLIEARSVGGLSGSPVFVGEDTYQGLKRQPLLGLIHGHYDWKDEASEVGTTIQTGIAIVTPSYKILDILRSPECVSTRAQFSCIF